MYLCRCVCVCTRARVRACLSMCGARDRESERVSSRSVAHVRERERITFSPFSGEAKDSAIFPFFILLQERAQHTRRQAKIQIATTLPMDTDREREAVSE